MPERAWGFKSPLGHTQNRPLTCGNAIRGRSRFGLWDTPWDTTPVAVNFPVTSGDSLGREGARLWLRTLGGALMAQWVRRPRTDGGERLLRLEPIIYLIWSETELF